MTDREKLIELIETARSYNIGRDGSCYGEYRVPAPLVHDLADHLIANGVTVQKWIPVTERLPNKYRHVLAYVPTMKLKRSQAVCEAWLGEGEIWHSSTIPVYQNNVTHWMPLPEPPKE